ncbi:hypothetical protein P7K49_028036, partial [Saguinus oedipus]
MIHEAETRCQFISSAASQTQPLRLGHVRQVQMKKHPCRQCDKSFSSSHSLCRHNRIKHKGIRKVYACS